MYGALLEQWWQAKPQHYAPVFLSATFYTTDLTWIARGSKTGPRIEMPETKRLNHEHSSKDETFTNV